MKIQETKKLKTFTKIFAGLMILALLCAIMLILIPIIGTPSPVMIAEKLSDKPEEYFVVIDADPILLQAISQLGKSVRFNSLSETQIDELTSEYMKPNLKYQNNYYNVGILIGDPPMIYGQVFLLSIFGLIVTTIILISLAIHRLVGLSKKKIEAK